MLIMPCKIILYSRIISLRIAIWYILLKWKSFETFLQAIFRLSLAWQLTSFCYENNLCGHKGWTYGWYCDIWQWTTGGWCYSIAQKVQPRVQLSNTSREWFIVKYHNNICSHFYHACWILLCLLFQIHIKRLGTFDIKRLWAFVS